MSVNQNNITGKSKQEVVLLTGGTGFLGAQLARQLLLKGYTVILLKRSFSKIKRITDILTKCKIYDIDKLPLAHIFENNKINIIIHCATDYGRYQEYNNVINANLILPLDLLALGVKYKVRYFINTDTVLDKRINSYSLSKSQFLDWLNFYSKKGITSINIAIEHFYGPFDNKSKFISKMIHSILNDSERIQLTPGNQQRDFIYIDDVVQAFLCIIDSLDKFEDNQYFFEVGTNINTSIKELLLRIKNLAKNSSTKLEFGALSYRENEIMCSSVNTDTLKALGWSAKTELVEGLIKTIKAEQKIKEVL